MSILKRGLSRRRVLQTGMAGIIGSGVAPLVFTKGAWAQEFCNNPTGDTVVFGLNLPLTGTYAEEGADEQKAYELAIAHINGEGDGGLVGVLAPHLGDDVPDPNKVVERVLDDEYLEMRREVTRVVAELLGRLSGRGAAVDLAKARLLGVQEF
jgi:hypothetical protein